MTRPDHSALRTEFMDRFSALIVQLQQQGVPGDRYAETIAQANIPDLLRHELGELRLLRNRCAHQGEPGNQPLGLAELEAGMRRLSIAERQISQLQASGTLGARQEHIPADVRQSQRQDFLTRKAQEEAREREEQEAEERAFQERLRQAALNRERQSAAPAPPAPERRAGHPRIILCGCLLLLCGLSAILGSPLVAVLLAALTVIVWLI